jgi:hypothetical protein
MLTLFAVGLVVGFLAYLEFFFLPEIITIEVPNVPINNNTYPILLQALIIVGGVILGLVGSISIEIFKKLGKINSSNFLSGSLYFILLFIFLLSAFLITFSILFSITGMLYYSIVNTYVVTQINTGIIHTEVGGNVILINNAYFNNSKSNVIGSIKNYYTSLVSSTKIAIDTLVAGFVSWFAFVGIYTVILFYTNIIVVKKQNIIPPPPPSSLV